MPDRARARFGQRAWSSCLWLVVLLLLAFPVWHSAAVGRESGDDTPTRRSAVTTSAAATALPTASGKGNLAQIPAAPCAAIQNAVNGVQRERLQGAWFRALRKYQLSEVMGTVSVVDTSLGRLHVRIEVTLARSSSRRSDSDTRKLDGDNSLDELLEGKDGKAIPSDPSDSDDTADIVFDDDQIPQRSKLGRMAQNLAEGQRVVFSATDLVPCWDDIWSLVVDPCENWPASLAEQSPRFGTFLVRFMKIDTFPAKGTNSGLGTARRK
jgi:hypothetical protein